MTRANQTPEKEFQRTLVAALEVFGYLVNHTYPLRTEHGWRTGTTAKGWPDLTALRPPRLLAIEVKGEHTPLEPNQRAWLTQFAAINCHRAWVIRPTDPPWEHVQAWIRTPREAPRVHGFEPMPMEEAYRLLARPSRR